MRRQSSKMVGQKRLVLEEILNEKQIHHVLKQSLGDDVPFVLEGSEVKPASDGLCGFSGEHLRAALHVNIGGEKKKVCLFLKRIPVDNKPKADFINDLNFFRREVLMFKVLEEIYEDGQNPWCVKPYLYTDNILVMPDLAIEGYASPHYLNALDSDHIFVATTTIARFHAAFINYETKKSINLKHPYRIIQEYDKVLTEPIFREGPWLRAASKLSVAVLKAFSTKSYHNIPYLESTITKLYIEACDSLTEHKETLNTLLHKDLWVNNIMYKREDGRPTNAVLVDYQCLRYGPPAFDLMIFLYFCTDRSFRDAKEKEVQDHYYSIFERNLNDDSRKRLQDIGYDKGEFLKWCDKARMFGMFETIAIYPFVLMDPMTAQKTFDDPETFNQHYNVDRSEPVVAHAAKVEPYKRRNLEITEEFVERYVLKQL